MHSWPFVLLLSGLALLFGTAKILQKRKGKEVSLAFTAYILAYGLSSSAIAIISVFIWHIHSLTGFIIHYHPGNLSEIPVFRMGQFHVDLLSVLVIGLTILFFGISFIMAQIFLHFYLAQMDYQYLKNELESPFDFDWLEDKQVLAVRNELPDAFSFTTLTPRIGKPKVRDWIVITTGLLDILNEDELQTVVAHEVGHLDEEDTRYSHLLFTLSSIMFFDPILKFITSILNRSHEFEADRRSVELTQKPKSLANALFKMIEFNHKHSNTITPSFFSKKSELLKERIERLLEMAQQMN